MSEEPDGSGETPPAAFEVIIVNPRRAIWRRRLNAARRGGVVVGRVARRGGLESLKRVRSYLSTPEGRRVAANGAVAAVAIAGGVVLLRRWLGPARAAAAGLATVYRTVRDAAGAVGAAVGAGRWLLPLRGIWRALRAGGLAATLQLYRPCPDCHARVHHDATVCWRCGCRDLSSSRRPRRGPWLIVPLRFLLRVLTFRLTRACPDCHRSLHRDARLCWRCGWTRDGRRARGGGRGSRGRAAARADARR